VIGKISDPFNNTTGQELIKNFKGRIKISIMILVVKHETCFLTSVLRYSGNTATPVFLPDLGFFCFIWGFGVFIENLFFLYSGQMFEMYVVLVYFPFKNTAVIGLGVNQMSQCAESVSSQHTRSSVPGLSTK